MARASFKLTRLLDFLLPRESLPLSGLQDKFKMSSGECRLVRGKGPVNERFGCVGGSLDPSGLPFCSLPKPLRPSVPSIDIMLHVYTVSSSGSLVTVVY